MHSACPEDAGDVTTTVVTHPMASRASAQSHCRRQLRLTMHSGLVLGNRHSRRRYNSRHGHTFSRTRATRRSSKSSKPRYCAHRLGPCSCGHAGGAQGLETAETTVAILASWPPAMAGPVCGTRTRCCLAGTSLQAYPSIQRQRHPPWAACVGPVLRHPTRRHCCPAFRVAEGSSAAVCAASRTQSRQTS